MQLIITRDTGMYSKIRKNIILLDGNCLCSFSDKETRSLDINGGLHTVSAKIACFETNRIAHDFDLHDMNVRLISSYTPMADLKKGLMKISFWNPIHNVKETIRTLKNSFAGWLKMISPMLELKNESETW